MQTYTEKVKSEKAATMEEMPKTNGSTIKEVKEQVKPRSTAFKPRPTLLIDIAPVDEEKKFTPKETAKPSETPEPMLQQLLINTEASAERTEFSKRKWQLAALVLVMLFIPIGILAGWLYVGMNSASSGRGRMMIENTTLKEEIESAGARITGLRGEIEILMNRNIELVGENAKLKSELQTAGERSIAAAEPVVRKEQARPVEQEAAAKATPMQRPRFDTVQITPAFEAKVEKLDTGRIESIRKGTYPKGSSKTELIVALGEPNRIYRARGYEQLLYFNRTPGRFWFMDEHLIQTSN